MTREEAIKILVRAQRGLIATALSEYEHNLLTMWTRKPLGAQEQRKKRCEESLERHDFGEEEGANQWMRSNAPC